MIFHYWSEKSVGSVEIVSRLIYGVTLNILIFELLCVPKRVIELFSIATTNGGKKDNSKNL